MYDAAVNFNDGRQGTIEIFKKLNITPGHYTTVLCYMLNKRRIYSAKYKAKASTKKARKLIRAMKKWKGHTEKKLVGKTYKCGGF